MACEICNSGQLLDSQYRRGKDATVTGSYSSWQQEPFNGRKVDLPRLGEYGNDLAKLVS